MHDLAAASPHAPRRQRLRRSLVAEDGGVLLLLAALWLGLCAPLMLGERTLWFRDVFNWHLPLRALVAEALRAGHLPAFAPAWALGQPLRGNPNAFAFYPDTLLLPLLDLFSAYNLHFVLHWLLAFVGLRRLARDLGQSRAAATFAALCYAGSGYFFSLLTFAGAVATVSWWPWAMLAVRRPGARGLAGAGLAVGLALLAGEPIFAALSVLPFLLVATERWGLRRGLVRGAEALALGALVALPQLVATLRILPFTYRGGRGVLASNAVAYALQPERLLELVLPFPFGIPGEPGALGTWHALSVAGLPGEPPYILSLYAGLPALVLAVRGIERRRRAWTLLAGAGLLGAWLGRFAGAVLPAMTAGLFRFPEKLLSWFALAFALLAGWGLDRMLEERPRRWSALRVGGAATLAAAAALTLLPEARAAALPWLAGLAPAAATVQRTLLVLSLALAAGLALATAWALGRRQRQVLLLLELLALLQLLPLFRTEPTAPYRQPPGWSAGLASGTPVVAAAWQFPPWPEQGGYDLATGPATLRLRLAAADLHHVPGVLLGLRYPTAPDVDGLQSPLSDLVTHKLPGMDAAARRAWLAVLGVDALVTTAPTADPAFELSDSEERAGAMTRLYRRRIPSSPAYWPQRLQVAAGPAAALAAVGALADPEAEVVTARPVDQHPGGRVRVVSEAADRIELEVESDGGLLVVRRAYQQLYRARSGDRALATQPAQLVLLGVEVPPGRHRVMVDVTSWPEEAATAIALAVAVVLAGLLLRRRSPDGPPLTSPG